MYVLISFYLNKLNISFLDKIFSFNYFDVFVPIFHSFIFWFLLCLEYLVFIRLLHTLIISFLLSVDCKFSGVFIFRDDKMVIPIYFSFKSFRLINLDVTQIN